MVRPIPCGGSMEQTDGFEPSTCGLRNRRRLSLPIRQRPYITPTHSVIPPYTMIMDGHVHQRILADKINKGVAGYPLANLIYTGR